MPQCRCGESDPEKFSKKLDGLQSECKTCHNALNKIHYQENKQYYIDKAQRRKEELVSIILGAKSKKCTDCQTQYPTWVMTFDHLPQFKKSFSLSLNRKILSYSVKTILAEIAKCEVVCMNCHADRTHSRLPA